MGDVPKELQHEIIAEHEVEAGERDPFANTDHSAVVDPRPKSFRWWIRVSIYSVFVLAGQAVATLLGRLYYDKGGKSEWIATLMQLVGFALLVPLYWFSVIKSRKKPNQVRGTQPQTQPQPQSQPQPPPPSYRMLVFVYVFLGILVAVTCFLYSVGLLYLPVSTYSLICATQLAFNAIFSFFLNSQKFSPYIINSLVLLTISSTLLVLQPDSSSSNTAVTTSKDKYTIGFICTVGASAGYGLVLSLTELAFRKVIKQETFKAVLEMLIHQSLVSSILVVVGLFASGDWKRLHREMEDYELGKMSYGMTLTWTAVSWGLCSVGSVGLIFDVSSLFSNATSAVGLPIIPVLAVVFFSDSMDGIKVVSMVLAIWGFVSYVYQHYLEDTNSRKKMRIQLTDPVHQC